MLYQRGMDVLNDKEQRYGAPLMRELERIWLVAWRRRSQWMDHIDNMDQRARVIVLRGYGQKDPVVEYRIEGFDMFDQMVDSIRESSVKMLLTIEVREAGKAPKCEQAKTHRRGLCAWQRRTRRKGRTQGPACPRHQDRPQRPLPLRQRPEVEKVYLRLYHPRRKPHRGLNITQQKLLGGLSTEAVSGAESKTAS